MSIFFGRPEKAPLEQSRGIESIDIIISTILVRASVEPVAQAFSSIKHMDFWERDAYYRDVEIKNESTFVFQFKGHLWSLIFKPYSSLEQPDVTNLTALEIEELMRTPLPEQLDPTAEDALKISGLLHTPAIYYAGSDTCGTIEYHLYNDGVLVERLFFEEEDTIEFQSERRQIEAKDIDAYIFAEDFIREQDAYVPRIHGNSNFLIGQRKFLQMENLMPYEVERMDYLARQ